MAKLVAHVGVFLALIGSSSVNSAAGSGFLCDERATTVSELVDHPSWSAGHIVIQGKLRKTSWNDRFVIEVRAAQCHWL